MQNALIDWENEDINYVFHMKNKFAIFRGDNYQLLKKWDDTFIHEFMMYAYPFFR